MENNIPAMFSERFPIIAYVDFATFKKVEEMRGDVSRSRFIGKIIQKAVYC